MISEYTTIANITRKFKCQQVSHFGPPCITGATEIARPSKSRGLTSRNWTAWCYIASVDIARPDNAAPDNVHKPSKKTKKCTAAAAAVRIDICNGKL